ncbi:unnamed protein product [Echinostoma caproni]|uniref:Cadherin domain-containing protein n=1 Tax=Echinostoma caproni TaxID=27848 RepID=A0A183A5Y3_9TREM|nr:unnamed protein product [Echinostoma caproni]
MWSSYVFQRVVWNLLHLACIILIRTQNLVFAQITLEFTLTEECPLHTFIGNLNGAPLTTVNVPSYPLSTFQLLTQTNHFILNETSGDLFTRNRIDRERLCPRQMQTSTSLDSTVRMDLEKLNFGSPTHPDLTNTGTDNVCKVQLQALQFTQKTGSNTEPMTHRVILIKVIILDVNDNPPGWPESVIHLSVPEHSPIGTRLPLPAAFDPDCGPINTTMSYVLRDLASDDRVQHSQLGPFNHEAFQLDTEFLPSPNQVDVGLGNLPNLWLISGCSRRMFRLWLRVVRDLDYDNPESVNSVGQQQQQQQTQQHQALSGLFGTNRLHLRNARLQLVAADGGQPTPLTGHVMINITVTDINDHPPIFQLGSANQPPKELGATGIGDVARQEQMEIEENTPVGRVVYVARATDVDDIDNGHLLYQLDTSASLSIKKMFEVNAKTGEIVLLQSPDFERQRIYNVPLTVSDGKHVTSLNLFVRIRNQNDHPPVITIRPVGQPKDEHGSKLGTSSSHPTSSLFPHAKSVALYVVEHDAPGRFIATVTVTDVDDITGIEEGPGYSGEGGSNLDYLMPGLAGTSDTMNLGAHCKLSHAGLALRPLFEGSTNQFKLVTQTSFDREQQTEQFATLTCFDRGHPPLSTQLGIHLIIEDINDHGPIFKHTPMIAHLKENEPIGTKVYTVEAHDPDVGENAQLGFALDDLNSNDFTIDSRTGVISSLRSFDREQREYFNLTVIVRDQVSRSSSADGLESIANLRRTGKSETKETAEHKVTGYVIVYIKDVNDCPPIFPNSLYQLSVSEDAKINLLIGQINASDADATEANNQVS